MNQKHFYWKGINNLGEHCKGTAVLSSKDQLKNHLLSQGVALVSFKEKRVFSLKRNINSELIYFFSSLAIFLESGITLSFALKILMNKSALKSIKNIIEQVLGDLNRGFSFGSSLDRHLEPIIVKVILVGEESNNLSLACNQVSSYLSFRESFKKEVRSALFLPALTFIISSLLILLIFIFVIPRFEVILSSLNKPLPTITKIVFSISRGMTLKNLGLIIVSVTGLGFILKKFSFVDTLSFRLSLFHLFDLIRFTRSLSMLHRSGTSIMESLVLSRSVIRGELFKEKVSSLINYVNKGESLEVAMNKLGDEFFPSEFVAVISVGENSDNLSNMLDRACVLFEKDLKRTVNIFIKIINPAVMIILGLFVALVMMAIYVPIFSLASSI